MTADGSFSSGFFDWLMIHCAIDCFDGFFLGFLVLGILYSDEPILIPVGFGARVVLFLVFGFFVVE
jgi:hypothetical protein